MKLKTLLIAAGAGVISSLVLALLGFNGLLFTLTSTVTASLIMYFALSELRKKMSFLGKISFIVVAILTYYSFNPAYYSPEGAKTLFLQNGISMAASYDAPTFYVVVRYLWVVYVLMLYGNIFLKILSSIILGEGMDYPESCNGTDLLNQRDGDMAYIKVGGYKSLPVRGSSAWMNPLTHIYRRGKHLIFTANMEPNTDLMNVPFNLKPHIRARRKSDIFELKSCSIGYLSKKEISAHKTFDKEQYEAYLTKEEKEDMELPGDTVNFLDSVKLWNRLYDVELQEQEFENTAKSRFLIANNETGKLAEDIRKKSIRERLGI